MGADASQGIPTDNTTERVKLLFLSQLTFKSESSSWPRIFTFSIRYQSIVAYILKILALDNSMEKKNNFSSTPFGRPQTQNSTKLISASLVGNVRKLCQSGFSIEMTEWHCCKCNCSLVSLGNLTLKLFWEHNLEISGNFISSNLEVLQHLWSRRETSSGVTIIRLSIPKSLKSRAFPWHNLRSPPSFFYTKVSKAWDQSMLAESQLIPHNQSGVNHK